jgi:hypothetical protein
VLPRLSGLQVKEASGSCLPLLATRLRYQAGYHACSKRLDSADAQKLRILFPVPSPFFFSHSRFEGTGPT